MKRQAALIRARPGASAVPALDTLTWIPRGYLFLPPDFVPDFLAADRTGNVAYSTVQFEGAQKDALLKSGPVRCVAVDTEFKHVVTSGEDKQLKVWELEGLKLVSESYPLHPDPVPPSSMEPGSSKRGSLTSHENPSNGKLILGHTSLLTTFLLTEDEKYVVSADRDEHIRVSWYPQGYVIERYCLGHRKYVSAIHIPSFAPSVLLSGGGDPTIKLWDWMSGGLLVDVPIGEAVEPYIKVKAPKSRFGRVEDDDDEEQQEKTGKPGRRRRNGRGKGKSKGTAAEEDAEGEIGEQPVLDVEGGDGDPSVQEQESEAMEVSAPAPSAEPAQAEASSAAESEKSVLVLQRIDSLDVPGKGRYVVFSAVGSTALFSFQFPFSPVTQSEFPVDALDLGKPVIDFTVDSDGSIWVLVDGERLLDSSTVSDKRAVRLVQWQNDKLAEVTNGEFNPLLSSLNTACLLPATDADLKMLDIYSSLVSLPKNVDAEHDPMRRGAYDNMDFDAPNPSEESSRAGTPQAGSKKGKTREPTQRELARMKKKRAVLAKIQEQEQATKNVGERPTPEVEPERKKAKAEGNTPAETNGQGSAENVIRAAEEFLQTRVRVSELYHHLRGKISSHRGGTGSTMILPAPPHAHIGIRDDVQLTKGDSLIIDRCSTLIAIMQSSQIKNLEVAIVGGGVCGLTCAIALRKQGIPVQVYEAAAHFGEIGAGLGIGSNSVKILKKLGLIEDIVKQSEGGGKGRPGGWFQFLSGKEGHELIYDYTTPPGEGSIGIHRAKFLDALIKHIDPGLVHFHKQCTEVVEPDFKGSKLTLQFADGTNATADIVLGADGIKSAVRGAVLGADPHSVIAFSNTVCYRGLVPTELVRSAGITRDYRDRPICYVGHNKHMIVYEIQGGTLVNIVAFAANHNAPLEQQLSDVPTVTPVDSETLLKEYQDFGSEVTGLLRCVQKPNQWTIDVVYPALQSYVQGRVALLGDAAHAMLPHLGAGSGQGIEDAEMLAELLGHPQTTLENVEEILKVYDEIRRPRAQKVWEGSVHAGRVVDGYGPSGMSADGLRKDIPGMWDFVWRHDMEGNVQQAVQTLEERGVFTKGSKARY
ncbi:hypothetical protein NM688_g5882 [Phlebia brevispora]|uniref:Uncharacterized protein n=1 Tax=Phlebia brevispora TaxID=194682 RepID=A0ACC1SND3_9APHY|nr:hypothetical protein NM688_g5882 [Phlebia brevispora]